MHAANIGYVAADDPLHRAPDDAIAREPEHRPGEAIESYLRSPGGPEMGG